ncbi:MAG: hypothetical protein AAF957_09205 [Planctomycetota bacterium]
MLHTSLAAALLAPSPAPIPQDQVLDLLPAGSPIVLAVGDLAGAIAAEEKPAWIAFMTDPRIRDIFSAVTELDDELESGEERQILMEVVRSIRGGGFAVTDANLGTLVGALRVTDDFVPAMTRLVGAMDDEMVESDVLGMKGLRTLESGMEGLTLVEVGGLMLFGGGSHDMVDEELKSVVEAMEDSSGDARWWTSSAAPRVDGPMVELFLSLDVVADMEAEFAEVFDDPGSAYLGLGVGEGREGAATLWMDFGPNEFMRALAPAFGEADAGLLDLAPQGALAVTALNVDIGALLQAAFLLSGDADAESAYSAALEAGSSTLGVDIEEEILGNLTGDMAFVQWPVPADLLGAEDPEAVAAIAPTLMFGISDSEPFYTLIETAEGFLGPAGLEAVEISDGTIWSTEPVPGVEISLALTETQLILGTSDRVDALLARSGGPKGAGMLGETELAAAGEMLEGAYISAVNLAEGFGMAVAALESDTAMADDTPEEVAEMMIDAMSIAAEYLDGPAFMSMSVGAKVVDVRMVTR